MTRRADFLAANSGKRAPMPGFVLLVRPRGDADSAMRLGITVTKKIGGAVVRNRMKRRFRALAAELLPEGGVPGADHVLIGRAGGVERDFGLLRAELAKALKRLDPANKKGAKDTGLPELVEGLPSSFFSRTRQEGASTGSAKSESGIGGERS